MTDALEDHEGTVSTGGRSVTNLRFADDIHGIAGEKEELAKLDEQAIGPREDLLTIAERRRLTWHGHVSRSSGLAKTILQSTVKGGERHGRPKKMWEDNIREWTGLEFAKSKI